MKNCFSNSVARFLFFSIITLLLSFKTLNAQINDREIGSLGNESNLKSRLFYGGGFGLQVGNVTLIELSPLIGYKATPKFGIGISPSYKYYRIKNYYSQSVNLETNVFGGSVFARYMIIESIFAHAEYETLYYKTKVPGSPIDLKQYNSVLVGGGYRQMIGENAAMNLMVLWNLNDTPDSPYSNPVIRIGFSVGM